MSAAIAEEGNLSNLIIAPDTPIIAKCWQSIEEICARERPVLLIIDCLYLAHDGDENDASSMRRGMQYFLFFRNKFNLAVLVVHHVKKGSGGNKLHSAMM